MEFVEVNYALNAVYRVEKNALLALVASAVTAQKELRLIDAHIEMNALSSLVAATVRVSLDEKAPLDLVIPRVANMIEDYMSNLLNSKPKNVAIIVSERFNA